MSFDWSQALSSQATQNPMAAYGKRPNPVDMSERWVVNDALAIGLFRGTYPGLKLASALAYPMIAVRVAFMGLPTPTSDTPSTQELLTRIQAESARTLSKLFYLRPMVGTSWVWPNWDSRRGRVFDEIIPNASISDVVTNINTHEIDMIITDEQITWTMGENSTGVMTRKRYFTTKTIKYVYTGQVPPGLTNSIVRNTSGVMPIPFACDVLDNSVRGESVYTRVLSHLKNYHDVMVKWSQASTKANPKLAITMAGTADQWFMTNAHLGTADELDIEDADLILLTKEERAEYIQLTASMAESFKSLNEATFLNIVEGSGLPEIAFGIATTGNHASAEQDMAVLSNTVMNDRSQIEAPAYEYFAARLRLEMNATMTQSDPTFKLAWNDLDVVSEEVRAKIQATQAETAVKFVEAGWPLESMHKFYMETQPKATEPDFEKWKAQMDAAAKYKQFSRASLTDAIDMAGSGV